MEKPNKPSQAVIDFNRLEFTYNRATSQKLDRKDLDFWIAYYQRRIDEIAANHKMEIEDIIASWMKWRASSLRSG